MADCIVTEMDADGNLNGFSIRPELAKVAWVRGGGDVTFIQKMIRTVNFLNRLLLAPGEDYMLGTKRAGAQLAERGSNTDAYHPATVAVADAEAAPERPPSDDAGGVTSKKPAGGALSELLRTLRGHAIDILTREAPSKRAYYGLVWENQSLEELASYRLPDVYSEVPDGGSAGAGSPPDERLTVLGYLQHLFKELADKLEAVVPREEKHQLSIKQLVWAGEPADSVDGEEPRQDGPGEQALQDGGGQ